MLSLSDDNQSEVIEASQFYFSVADDLLNINNNFFNSMVNHIYPTELHLNKANVSDTETLFLSPDVSRRGLLFGVRPSVRPSVRRYNLVCATPPTVFKGF